MRITVLLLAPALLLAGCDLPSPVGGGAGEWVLTPEEAAQGFTEVVRAVEPVAERECRRYGTVRNCDFLIAVDPNPRAQPNAFQSVDEQGRPVLTFTASLIGSVHNADELAFVMGHEAAHHIANHLERQRRNSADAAEIFGGLATLTGGGSGDVERAREIGAVVGARSYAKEFELEADKLGTVITWRAGYDPLVGAQFFTRLPDPGDKFLASHPPNKARMDLVASTVRSLGG
ncbi:M48 family metalloprotease [Microbulbifer sp. S227A]|uniref:M48 family metalloprotease n=1 Tax=Microbulbifer sp. S227A TaxID=3415131 RepID=UPI003C7E8467